MFKWKRKAIVSFPLSILILCAILSPPTSPSHRFRSDILTIASEITRYVRIQLSFRLRFAFTFDNAKMGGRNNCRKNVN